MSHTILLTGATSGFGAVALETVAAEHDGLVIVGARDPSVLTSRYGERVTAVPLDLDRLESVRAFCQTAATHGPIGVMALNAGINPSRIAMTEDGFERAFQVNYLAHALIYQSLRAELSDDALVMTTGSGTHDPEEKTPPPPPRHANIAMLADPSTDPDRDRMAMRAGMRAYTSSKLCCIMMALELARQEPGLTLASFDPGFVPDTRLTRDIPGPIAAVAKRIIPFTMANDRTSSSAASGKAYADLILRREPIPRSGAYVGMRAKRPAVIEPSAMAQDADLAAKMWNDTLDLLTR